MLPVHRLPGGLIWPGLPLLYLLLPGHALGLHTGTPLSAAALTLAVFVALATWCGCRPSPWLNHWLGLCLLLAAALKVLAGGTALPYGLTATYRSPGSGQSHERSTEWRVEGATRVDRRLDFVGDQFPVYFFNDLARFNFYTANQPRRDLLPLHVTWRGWLVEAAAGQRCFRFEAHGTAALRLADFQPVAVERASHAETRETCGSLSPGSHLLEVEFARPEGGVPLLKLWELQPDGQTVALGAERFLQNSASIELIERDRWLGRAAWALDALVAAGCLATILAGLARIGRLTPLASRRFTPDERHAPPASRPPPLVVWERPLLALSILAALAEAFAVTRHFAGRTPILSGGNDWLAYESYARDVLLTGPLLTAGKALGQGETFYYQPLYIYFLGVLHALLGESVHGILLAQHVLVAFSGVLTYFLARELFGRPTAAAAFALFWVFRYLIFNQVAGLLLSENLVVIIVPPMLLLLARWQRTWRQTDLVGGAALLGLAILTRSTPLLFLLAALPLVGLAQLRKFGHWRAAIGAAGLLLIVTLCVAGLVGLRNLLVAGRPALLPESASANLWEAHRPSTRVDLSRVDRDDLYNQLRLDRKTREVLEFIRQDPRGYAASLVPMGLYAIGVTGPALGTHQLQHELVTLTALYAAGLLFVPAVRSGPVWLLHTFVLTHFVQMMIFMSHQYGFRLPLPMYGPMIVVAARSLVALGQTLGRILHARVGPPVLLGAATIAVMLAALWTAREFVRQPDVEADVFGLGGDAAPAARAVAQTPESWQVDRLYFAGQDGRSFGTAYLPGLAYREMKWFDVNHAFVWPSEGKQGMRLLPPSMSTTPRNLECWNRTAPGSSLRELPGGANSWVQWLPGREQVDCEPLAGKVASFGRLVELLHVTRVGPREAEVRAAWRVAQRPSFRTQLVLESLDATGEVVATSLVDPYPSRYWETGELIIAQVVPPADERAPAEPRQLAIGFTRGTPGVRLTIDDPLALYNRTRIVIDE